jgi:hypothetical protein
MLYATLHVFEFIEYETCVHAPFDISSTVIAFDGMAQGYPVVRFTWAMALDWVVTFTLSASSRLLFGKLFCATVPVTLDMSTVVLATEFEETFIVVFVDCRFMFIGELPDIVPFSDTLELEVVIGLIVVVVDVPTVEVAVVDVVDIVDATVVDAVEVLATEYDACVVALAQLLEVPVIAWHSATYEPARIPAHL